MRDQTDGWAVRSGQYQRATKGYAGEARLPSWHQEEPVVLRGDQWWLDAFWRLGTTRQFSGQGWGPIPWTAARDYAIDLGFDTEWRRMFCDVILQLDRVYRAAQRTPVGQ